VTFTPDGKEKNRLLLSYGEAGVLLSIRRIVGNAYYESILDPATGLAKSSK
jgi:hypothetical protein